MNVISAVNLSKRYGKTNAVNNLSFDISQGEIVGFLGPNGAGKTTTLRMLAGLIKPSKGRSEILGQKVPSNSLLSVGTMIEEPSFYKYMTGRDNLRHAAMLHGGVDDKYIDEMLEFVSMEKAAKKRVGAYSQGMRQRLGLARSLLWKPKVLLLDEPTNGLDPVGIAEIRENLRTIAKQGVTILISSHILAELEKFVERIIAVEKGSLIYDGPMNQLISQMDEAQLVYLLEATNPEKLFASLDELGFKYENLKGQARAYIPQTQANTLVSKLIHAGVELTQASKETEDLEGAYLRLLKEDGRPS